MAQNNRDIRLTLGVGVDGADEVQKLAGELDALAAEGKDTASSFEVGGVAAGKLQAAMAELAATTRAHRTAEASAQADIRTTRRALDEQRDALARLRIAYQSGSVEAEQFKTEELQLRTAILDSKSALREKKQAVTDATAAAKSAATAEQALATEIKAAAAAYLQAASASSKSTKQQVSDQQQLRDSVASVGKQLQDIQRLAGVALGGTYAGGLIKDLGETADEFQNLAARIKLTTGEGQQFNDALAGVSEVALQTHSALSDTTNLFSRLTKAGQEAGLSAQEAQLQALGLTVTINKAVQLSGSSAEASSAALTQLIQGLQSGVLRGEEFNSIMEQAPRLSQALAQGLGVTTGELRKMAEQGQLTTATVINALQGQADTVNAEFEKLPLTIGRALQDLKTQWTLYVGASDNGMVSSQNAAKIIQSLSNNLDTLVSVLYAAGKAWAAFKIAGLAGDLLTWATNTGRATAATEAHTVASAANTAAQRTNTAAQIENTAAIVSNAAARANNVAATAAGTAAATAGAAAQTALGAQTAATAGQVAKAGIVWRGFTSLFGPWGLVLAALLPEIKSIGVAIGETAAKMAGWGKALKDAEDRARAEEAATKAQIEAKTRLNRVLQEARDKQFELTKAAGGLIANFDQLRSKGDSAAEAIGKIGKDFDLSTVPGIRDATAVLDKLQADGKLTAEQFRAAWAKALDGKDLAVFEVEARAALAGTTREVERLAQIMDATLRAAVSRTGVEFEVLQGRVGSAARSAANDIDIIINGLERLKAEGVDTTRVLATQLGKAINTADSEKALEDLRLKIDTVRRTLGDKIADGLLDQAKQKSDALRDSLDNVLPGIQSVREAMRALGVTSDETLKHTAAQSEQAYRTLTQSGTASARELTEGFKKYAADAIAANNGVASSTIQTEAAMRGLVVSADSTGRNVIQTAAEAEKAIGRLAGAYDKAGAAAERSSAQAVAAIKRQAAALENLTADGFKANADGSAAGQFNNSLPVNYAHAIAEKLRKGELSADDLGAAKAAAKQAQDSQAWLDSARTLNAGAVSLDAMASTQALVRETQRALEIVQDMAGRKDERGSMDSQRPSTAQTPRETIKTLDIKINGQSRRVRVASQADSNTLTGILRDLESAAGSAS